MAFNRGQPPNQPQPPVSFKTVPGRNRTQKWQQAKTYNYDGDDWGGYDPYDEYSGYDDEPAASAVPKPAPIPPQQQQQRQEPRPIRQNSFDAGDERRAFSGSQLHPSGSSMGMEGSRGVSPSGSSAGRPSGDYGRGYGGMGPGRGSADIPDPRSRDRNFTNPEQVPPPLNTRTSPARVPIPAPASASSPGQPFPPRKSSVSQSSASHSPVVTAADAGPAAAKALDKPLPFIRPADIYKRMAEEKERERKSTESSRPSLDSVQREATSPLARTTDSPAPSLQQRNLHPVVERDEVAESPALADGSELPQQRSVPAIDESRVHEQLPAPVSSNMPEPSPLRDVGAEPQYRPLSSLQEHGAPTFGEPAAGTAKKVEDISPRLPPVSRFSGFGSDFIHGPSESDAAVVPTARTADSAASPLATQSSISSSPTSPQDDHFQSTIMRVLTSPVEAVSSHPDSHQPQEQHSPVVQHERTTDLQHQPSTASTGLTSVVHTAFDQPHPHTNLTSSELSRDNSQSMSRSNTTSTSTGGISPIMARVPAPFSTDEQTRDAIPPAIAEEATPTQSRHTSGVHDYLPDPTSAVQRQSIPRKPSPGHSRNVSAESHGPATIVQPGYRRSLDPPSSGSSPARTPAVEHGHEDRRLSTPLAAETVQTVQPGEEPDVLDQAAEVPVPMLRPTAGAETPGNEVGNALDASDSHDATHASRHNQQHEDEEFVAPAATAAVVQQARGEDYTAREVDLARLSIPNEAGGESTHSPPIAQAEAASQQQFLRTHERMPVPAPGSPASPGFASSPAYRSASPAFARPVSPNIAASAPGLGLTRSGTSGTLSTAQSPSSGAAGPSGRDSPGPVNAKGRRVREIAENYNSLDDASRRNSAVSLISSKSSWSQFGGQRSEQASAAGSPVKDGEDEKDDVFADQERGDGRTPRQSTALQSGVDGVDGEGESPRRAELQSQNSFRPHLPGEWVSFAPTPVGEEAPVMAPAAAGLHERSVDHEPVHRDLEAPPRAGADEQSSSPLTPRASHIAAQEDEGPVDFSPSARKGRFSGREFAPPTAPEHAGDAADAVTPGTNEPIDLTPTTRKTTLPGRDFSPDQQQPPTTLDQVKGAGAALGASLLGMTGLATTARDFGSNEPAAPVEQPEMRAKAGYGDVHGYLRPEMGIRGDSEVSAATDIDERSVASAASSVPPTPPAKDTPAHFGPAVDHEIGPGGRPISHYFSGAVPPLRTGHSREGSRDEATLSAVRPGMLPQLSTDTGFDDTENDRLRKEIVRSLGPEKREDIKRESIMEVGEPEQEEERERLQDALDAPENERRVEAGQMALPAAEAKAGEKPLPMMLDQRFSWESKPKGLLSPTMPHPPHTHEQELKAPEVLPEMPYERPRSRGLHVMNAGDSDDESPVLERARQAGAMESTPVSAMTGSVAGSLGAGLTPVVSPIPRSQHEDAGAGRLQSLEPSPMRGDELEATASRDSESTRLPSYYQTDLPGSSLPEPAATVAASKDMSPVLPERDHAADLPIPTVGSATDADTQAASSSPISTKQSSRIPPFREILAIKSSPDRIKTYDDTRAAFSNMDTGLSGWLSDMLAQHPEHANIGNAPSATALRSGTSGPGGYKHRANPSIAKFTKPFAGVAGSSSGGSGPSFGGDGRKASIGFGAGGGGMGGEGGMADVQQKGKELMKSAGVLGGKAQAGAKGLFQRGKLRLGSRREGGGEKALSSSAASRSVPLPLPTSKFSQYTPVVSSTPSTSATPGTASPTASSASLGQPAATSIVRATTPLARSRTPLSATAPMGSSELASDPVPMSDRSAVLPSNDNPPPSVDPPIPATSHPPIPRPQAVTYEEPASSSRPFSRTFTRLRARSRSKSASASGRSKSKSRPASLVIPTSNADLFPNWGDGDQRELERANRKAVAKAQETASPPAERRREAWEDDADEGASRQVGDDGGQDTPGRLGVLPSPAVETFGSFSEVGGRERKMSEVLHSPVTVDRVVREEEDMLANAGPEQHTNGQSSDPAERVEELPVQDEDRSRVDARLSTNLGEEMSKSAAMSAPLAVAAVPSTSLADVSADITTQTHESAPINKVPIHEDPRVVELQTEGSEDTTLINPATMSKPIVPSQVPDEPQSSRPQQTRKVSAIASLPSQQRSRALSPPQSPVPLLSRSPRPTIEPDEITPTQQFAQHPVASMVSASNMTQPAFDDHHSEVSAEGGADDDSVIHTRLHDPDHIDLSRQSSVSSLGDHGSTEPLHSHGHNVQRQEPYARENASQDTALPVDLPAPIPAQWVAEPEQHRNSPLSATIMSLPPIAPNTGTVREINIRDGSGNLDRVNDIDGQETLTIPSSLDTAETHASHMNELSPAVLGEPTPVLEHGRFPAATSPSQQPVLVRNSGTVQPTEYERLRGSQYGTPTPSTQHSRQVSNEDSKRNSRRYSGFFRGPDSTANTPPPMPLAQPDNSQMSNVADAGQDDKTGKRKSGIWQTFKRSPSASRIDIPRDLRQPAEITPSAATSDAAMIAAISARADHVESQRSRKVQRASSAATPPAEPKPRRFSGLGSLFGRSQTQGRNAEKPRKLTKLQPPSRRSTARQEPSNDGSSRGYDDFEAMRRQQIPDLQASRSPPPQQYMMSVVPQSRMSFDAQSPVSDQRPMPIPPSRPEPQGWYGPYDDVAVQQGQYNRVQSPPQGWYGPSSTERTSFDGQQYAQTAPYAQIETRPQYRRLHSQGHSNRAVPQASIPEAFRPTEASYGRQPEPIGPPVDVPSPIQAPPPGSQVPTLPTQQPYWTAPPSPGMRDPTLAIPRQRQALPHSAMPPMSAQDATYPAQQYREDPRRIPGEPSQRIQSPPTSEYPGMPEYHRQSSFISKPSARPPGEFVDTQTSNQENARRVSSPPTTRMQSPSAMYDERGAHFQRQASQHQRVRSSPLQQYRPEQAYSDYPGPNAYQSLQRPAWAPGHPPESQEQSYTSSRYPAQMRSPLPQQRWQSPAMPMSPQSPQADFVQQSRWAPPPQHDQYGQQYYPSPPHSAQSPHPQTAFRQSMSPPSHYDSRYPPPPAAPQNGQEYYNQAQPTADGRPLAYQGTLSEYLGRRDDATVSEQEIGMRSSSYPGQEWQPRV